MGELFSGRRFVWSRLWASWLLLLITFVGVLASAVLLSSASIYTSSLSTLGLQFRLQRTLDENRVSSVTVQGLTLDAVDLSRREAIDAAFDARIGWMGMEQLIEERSPRLFLDVLGSPEPGSDLKVVEYQQWNAFLFALPGYEKHVTVTEGQLPGTDTEQLEIVLPDGFQRHATLGDMVSWPLRNFNDCANIPRSADPELASQEIRCVPTTSVSRTVTAKVVGFVRPNDPYDSRWGIFAGSFEAPDEPSFPHMPEPEDQGGSQLSPEQSAALRGEGSMPMITSQSQLFGSFSAAMVDVPVRHRAGLLIDVQSLAPSDVDRALEALSDFRKDVSERLGLVPALDFPVAVTLRDFRNSHTFEKVPLLIILLQVAGIVLYYVTVVSSMLVERQQEEVGVYRSRGASTAQVLGLNLMEGILFAITATALAPSVARGAIAILGYTPIFRNMTDGHALPVTVTPEAYLLAAGGAVLGLMAMMVPAVTAARRSIVDVKQGQSRPSGRNFLQRYYLDLGSVVLAGILLWQLQRRDTLFDQNSVGGWSGDPILLAAPFVFTLAVSMMVLRFYPLLLRWMVGVLIFTRSIAVAVGLRRAARAPTTYARLLLLLLMSISVGTFAASYGATIDRSQTERILYSIGPDIRAPLSSVQGQDGFDQIGELRALQYVDDAAIAHRGELRASTNVVLQTLTLDPDRAGEMLWFREDFADESLAQLMLRLQSSAPSGGGVQLSEDAHAIRVAVRTSSVTGKRLLWARFRDAGGFYRDVVIAPIDFENWRELEIPLPEARRPLSFVGFRLTEPVDSRVDRSGSLYIDAVKEVSADGVESTLEDFEGGTYNFGWRIFGALASGEVFEPSDQYSFSGSWSAKWTWSAGFAPGLRFLLMNDPSVPLAAIVNPSAASHLMTGAGNDGEVVIGGVVVPVTVRGVTEMFPTLNPERPFMIVNFDHMRDLVSLLGVIGEGSYRWPNELWISTNVPVEEQVTLLDELMSSESPIPLTVKTRHRDGEIVTVRSDPTLRASGGGILIFAFGSVLSLSIIGFIVTLALDARSRIVEFAVLRAVGTEPTQILRSMALEWFAVLALGVGIGVLLGRQVASVMLGFLNVTEDGTRVVPPFILETDWLILTLGITVLVLVSTIGLFMAWSSSVRRRSALELRLTR